MSSAGLPEPAKHAEADVYPAIDTRAFRNAMGQFATGVVVISTEMAGQVHAMTANAFMSGSLEPPLILVSVADAARMHVRILASRRFAVSILNAEQQALSNHFAGKPDKHFIPSFERLDGLPVIAGALTQVATRLQHSYPCGDHTLFVGRVTALNQSSSEEQKKAPLIFQAGRYQALAAPQKWAEAAEADYAWFEYF